MALVVMALGCAMMGETSAFMLGQPFQAMSGMVPSCKLVDVPQKHVARTAKGTLHWRQLSDARKGSLLCRMTSLEAKELKRDLLNAVSSFKELQERDGKISVDFGVRGGELDSKSRAPRNLAEDGGFYKISREVGEAADKIFSIIDDLSKVNPNPEATKHFGTQQGATCKLHGSWKLLFTTAADATFSTKSKRGDARASNEVDAVAGKVMNIIEFSPRPDGSKPAVSKLQVRLRATALSATRVGLEFKYVKASLQRIFGLELPGRGIPLWFPVPGPALTRLLFFFRKVKDVPKAFFDVVYLDDQLRIHRTGEGNLFVQVRPDWEEGMEVSRR
eukprot:766960-Hanusia_phi.AAC.1